jgi:allantoicase
MSRLTHLVDLASLRLGGSVLAANDEFFAPKENLIEPKAPVFIPDRYTDRGKWMDGWETRRRRTSGHDWCIVRLGLAGVVKSIVVDTSFFRGNYPSHCSIDACGLPEDTDIAALTSPTAPWHALLAQHELRGDSQNTFASEDTRRVNHLRLNIFPDGGVARLRVLGEVVPDWRRVLATGSDIDLAAITHGAHVVDTSDRFFGEPANMLMPHAAANMGDGWETKRRRGPGHDWVVIRLAAEGVVRRIELDTAHFKGNYPESCSIEAAVVDEVAGTVSADLTSTVIGHWTPLLSRAVLQPDHLHVFEAELTPAVVATHVRLNIYPDGGVSRFRAYGAPTPDGRRLAILHLLNSMDDQALQTVLEDYCAAPGWISRMMAARPYKSAQALLSAAEHAADRLDSAEWQEAFRHHPRIGEQRAERTQSDVAQQLSAREQSSVDRRGQAAMDELAEANHSYEQRFGYVFIVSAAGKTAQEILDTLRDRLKNDPAEEIAVAAAEQRRITRLRLETLLG